MISTDHKDITQKTFKAEDSGRLPDEVLEFIYENHLFKFFVPPDAGGLGLDMPEALALLKEVSKIDGNLGWLLSTGSGASYFYGFMQQEIAARIFSSRESVIAGSGHPSGIAVPAENGYKINGTWKYCSGADFATTFTFNCRITGDESDIKAFIFNPDQVDVHPDWDGFGLKLTSSHTVSIEDIFIPEDHTFEILKPPYHQHSIYRFPFLPFAQASISTVGLGIAESLLQEADNILQANKDFWQNVDANRFEFVSTKINDRSITLENAKNNLFREVKKAWRLIKDEKKLADEHQQEIGLMSKNLSRKSLEAGTELIPYLGMQAIKQHNYINYLWRNLQTACQHILVAPF